MVLARADVFLLVLGVELLGEYEVVWEGAAPRAEGLREALEHVLDVWPAPSPEEFARLHRVLTGHDSCSRPSDERVPDIRHYPNDNCGDPDHDAILEACTFLNNLAGPSDSCAGTGNARLLPQFLLASFHCVRGLLLTNGSLGVLELGAKLVCCNAGMPLLT